MEAVKLRLARGYSRAAPLYDALVGHLYAMGIRRLLPRLRVPPMAAILDVGCGTGVNMLEAARWFAPTRQLCGIDISPGMVEVAAAKAAALGVPAQFTVGDAERLPYDDGQFDLVICNSVLHWFRDRDAAVREMQRVLKPGGQVAIIGAATPGFQEWFGLIDGLVRTTLGRATPPTLPALPTAAEVAALLLKNGFLIEHLANPVHAQRITDAPGFVRLMSTVAPHWAADLTPEEQARLELLATTAVGSWPGGFPNTWSAVEAVGSRVY